MTRVYQFAVQDGFEWAMPVDEEDFAVFRGFDGTRRRQAWTPIRMRLFHQDEEGRILVESDFPWLGAYAPVMRDTAIDALGALFSPQGELLPLSCEEANLHVFHALTVVDALDLERSDLVLYPNSDQIMQIKKYAFIAERIRGLTLFKVPRLLSHSLYITEEVVKAVNRSGLRGVGFRLLWDETVIEDP